MIRRIWTFFGFFYLGALFLAVIYHLLKDKFKPFFFRLIIFHLILLNSFYAGRLIFFQLKDFPAATKKIGESLVEKEMPYEGFQPELLRRADKIILQSANVIVWRPTGAFDLFRASYFLYPRIVYDTKVRESGDYIVSFLKEPLEATPSSDRVYFEKNLGSIYKVTRPDQPDVK